MAVGAHLLHYAYHPFQHLREQAGEGLVKEIGSGVHRQGASDFQQLALPVGQVHRQRVPLVPHPHVLQDAPGFLPAAGVDPFQQGPQQAALGEGYHYVVPHRHLVEKTHLLESAGQAVGRRFAGFDDAQAHPVNDDQPAVQGQDAAQQVDQG